ncbi:Mur ligase family protein [Psittacicella hinzii]|uniref:UDP-N-acetylmuramoyl-L-alanyl-D-glutamate--2,6-diaminopimelate ligase n=1 Tax=Psittacicella hinzii TaxID=2028575 RepID=A0A3A1YK69_9GAMM|nr:UDP-N-acetylmuramoyl-L-alanyl-D-glutamate--2,6-diaminopimelate ligase [Psittacicella hinzii]RIY38663.1 hypothetical protein CKF58_03655 [Psittacicella hinzii]
MTSIDTSSLVKQILALIDELKPLIMQYQLTHITCNSKEVDQHALFVATKGLHVDARDFIPTCVTQGGRVFISQIEQPFTDNEQVKAYKHEVTTINQEQVHIFHCTDLGKFLSFIALKFYDFLSSVHNPQALGLDIPVIGVTGTNGKTLTTNLIAQGLQALVPEKNVPYINGTIGYGPYGHLIKAKNTTPDACAVLDNIFQAQVQNSSGVVMEVSSHGLALNRVRNVRFSQAIFTNLTQDHLDYHKTIENYFLAKARFFTKHNVQDYIITCNGEENDYGARLVKLVSLKLAANDSDENSRSRGVAASLPALAALQGAIPPDEHLAGAMNTRPNPLGENDFSELQPADYDLVSQLAKVKVTPRIAVVNIGKTVNELVNFKADIITTLKNLVAHPKGLSIEFSFEDKLKEYKADFKIESSLVGIFNAYNLLTTITSLYMYGIELEKIVAYADKFVSVKGRMELMPNQLNKTIVVDFAHTPDALAKALESAKMHFNDQTDRKLTVVFGCGGDRDQGKRPIMGQIASTIADKIIITDDNPRSENPATIAEQIYAGFVDHARSAEYIPDRKLAIISAIEQAQAGDFILVAGKGHETEQIIGEQIHHFSDQEVIREYLEQTAKANHDSNYLL